jgi:hypothetical protein
MERHSVDEPTAFEMLRDHSRSSNRKLVDVSSAVVDGHRLLPKQPLSPKLRLAAISPFSGGRPTHPE